LTEDFAGGGHAPAAHSARALVEVPVVAAFAPGKKPKLGRFDGFDGLCVAPLAHYSSIPEG
jgi:hypothetical protein